VNLSYDSLSPYRNFGTPEHEAGMLTIQLQHSLTCCVKSEKVCMLFIYKLMHEIGKGNLEISLT
jgi:hypothetical protein